DAVPANQVRDGDAEAVGDQVEGIPASYLVMQFAGGAVGRRGGGRCGVLCPHHQLLTDRKRIPRRHAVPRGQLPGTDAIAAADRPEALAGADTMLQALSLALTILLLLEACRGTQAVFRKRLGGYRHRQVRP